MNELMDEIYAYATYADLVGVDFLGTHFLALLQDAQVLQVNDNTVSKKRT